MISTKTRNASEIRDATILILSVLTTSDNQPNLHVLDNEASSSLKQGLLKNNTKYQLLPLRLHRLNADEHFIQTFQAHFITCTCAADPKYPAKEWYHLLPQTTFTLNLLCNYRFNKNWYHMYPSMACLIIKNIHFPTCNQSPIPLEDFQ